MPCKSSSSSQITNQPENFLFNGWSSLHLQKYKTPKRPGNARQKPAKLNLLLVAFISLYIYTHTSPSRPGVRLLVLLHAPDVLATASKTGLEETTVQPQLLLIKEITLVAHSVTGQRTGCLHAGVAISQACYLCVTPLYTPSFWHKRVHFLPPRSL